jgi:hypothetical protein
VTVRFRAFRKGKAATVVGEARRIFQQALVNRAEFLGLHVAPVHRHEARILLQPGEPIDRLHQITIGETCAFEVRHGGGREQPVQRRQAKPRLAARQRREGDQQAFPAVMVPVPGGAAHRTVAQAAERIALGIELARRRGRTGRMQQIAVLGDEKED